MLHLSQGLLNLFAACPRKFQHLYIDQLNLPIAAEQQARLNWGNRFHLLMQQRELGLLEATQANDPEEELLYQAIEAIAQAAPALFQGDPTVFRQSEHRRTLKLNGYLLTAIYDLLILNEQQAQILDWKTYARPQTSHQLAQHWQTCLYLFLLAETSTYFPEQISMTYWFVQAKSGHAPQPQSLTFTYTQERHQQIAQDLDGLLCRLTNYLDRYQTYAESFPQVALSSPTCDTCSFAPRCQRNQGGNRSEPVATLEEIQEINL
ncbi:PD-(D/E)XK nuclease family protein [Phormidium tenue FACHB-886]|nr:PD-(D/E)XK nuclease family protein [Phormidium tenue FACHB-886]